MLKRITSSIMCITFATISKGQIVDTTVNATDSNYEINEIIKSRELPETKKIEYREGETIYPFKNLFTPKLKPDLKPDLEKIKLESQIKKDRIGSGKATFSLSPNFLEFLVKRKLSLNEFENLLGQWSSLASENIVWDEATNRYKSKEYKHSKYEIMFTYRTFIRSKKYEFDISILDKISNPLVKLIAITFLSDYEIISFRKALSKTFRLVDVSSNGQEKWVSKKSKTDLWITFYASGKTVIYIQ